MTSVQECSLINDGKKIVNSLKVQEGQNCEFRTETNYCSHLSVGFKFNPHSFSRSVKGTRSTRKQSVSLGGINVASTCD